METKAKALAHSYIDKGASIKWRALIAVLYLMAVSLERMSRK